MKRRRIGILLVAAMVLLAACRTGPTAPAIAADEIQLYAETAAAGGREWQLPQSGVRVKTDAQPLVDASGVSGVRVVTLDLGPTLVLDIAPARRGVFADLSGTRRLVLISHDRALGIVRLSMGTAISQISLFVEMPPDELNAWVNAIAAKLQDNQRSRGE